MVHNNTMNENKVVLTLAEFLELRDAEKLMTEIKAFALDSRADYSTDSRRDVHDIGYRVLALLNIPVKRDEVEDLFS